MSNGCLREQPPSPDFLKGWRIKLTTPPASATESDHFIYEIVREPRDAQGKFPNSQQMSNILICLCSTEEEVTALLDTANSSYTVFFEDSSSTVSTDVVVNKNLNPNANPAACIGIKFDNIPSGPDNNEQNKLVLDLRLTKSVLIGSVRIGFKAGNSSDIWMNVCGPLCQVPTPSRGILL
ncbi:MAG: hypothetical protein N4A62_17140 [Marinisporobacter sp.]|jgi:hypothetical protein|nr:hypothetical protein [Marinisporobacter sp.]